MPISILPTVLVVGAARGGLGEAIVDELIDASAFGDVYTAGLNEEDKPLNLLQPARIFNVLEELQPDIVVCTAGVNVPADIGSASLRHVMEQSFAANVVGPQQLLQHFVSSPVRPERGDAVKKFVAISSNSARIPRRNSAAYCASKAALSMALRIAARELAPAGQVAVWGYEPGLLAGTPMTHQAAKSFPGALHRMKGVPPNGIPPQDLARRIVQDLATFSVAQNGLIIPFDADEQ